MEKLYFIEKNNLNLEESNQYHKIIMIKRSDEKKIVISGEVLYPQIGDIFFINKEQKVRVDQKVDYTILYLQPDFRDHFLEFVGGFSGLETLEKEGKQLERLNKYLELPIRDYVTARLNYIEMEQLEEVIKKLEGIERYRDPTYSFLSFLECCTLLYNFLVKRVVESRDKEPTKKKYEEVEKIEEYITLNIDRKLTLEVIARNFGENSRSINDKFKEVKKISINQHLIDKRVKLASRILLEEDDIDIKTLGKIVGIRDESYFYKLFKKKTGYTPKEFKRKTNHLI